MGNSLDLGLLRREKEEDRIISDLPDDILLNILSFLPLKEMVTTSLLSRRWLHLWMHTPVLDFHAPVSDAIIDDSERQDYVKRVNHVLRRHKHHYLKEFKIVCHLDNRYQKDIDNWLEFALARKVEHLELNLLFLGCQVTRVPDHYAFPQEFLNFTSGGSRFLEFDFKCLKSLSLKNVDVTGEAIDFFLMNCPFLERLEVVGAGKLFSLVISSPNLALRYLRIYRCHNLSVIGISNFNLISLDIPSIRDLTLTDLPMLVELCISYTPFSSSRSLSQASCCHSQLEVLSLRGLYMKDVTQLSNFDQLTNLRRLAIEVKACRDESLIMLISVLNSFPRLEEFTLMLIEWELEQTTRAMIEVERSSSSRKNKSLKVFEFLGYFGRVSDVELVIHIVENAVCLEKIIIDPRYPTHVEDPRYSESGTERDEETRSIALMQFTALKKDKSIPPHIDLHIR